MSLIKKYGDLTCLMTATGYTGVKLHQNHSLFCQPMSKVHVLKGLKHICLCGDLNLDPCHES